MMSSTDAIEKDADITISWLPTLQERKSCLPVVKKPKPHSVSAMLALAPKELALLMYMMTGDAAIVQAQLKRLSFCKLKVAVN